MRNLLFFLTLLIGLEGPPVAASPGNAKLSLELRGKILRVTLTNTSEKTVQAWGFNETPSGGPDLSPYLEFPIWRFVNGRKELVQPHVHRMLPPILDLYGKAYQLKPGDSWTEDLEHWFLDNPRSPMPAGKYEVVAEFDDVMAIGYLPVPKEAAIGKAVSERATYEHPGPADPRSAEVLGPGELLVRLLELFPFSSVAEGERALATKLPTQESDGVNESFLGKMGDRSPIGGVELRTSPANFTRQLLILKLKKPVPLKKSELDKLLKQDGVAMGFASPHKPELGTYAAWQRGGFEIRVGFTDLNQDQVRELVLDAFKPAP
jgi:hypothetical protein